MQKRPETHYYTVVGARAAEFPLDMLKFSQSWPADDDAVRLISILTLPLEADGRDEAIKALDRKVEIRLGTPHDRFSLPFGSALRRWESFGWIVKIEKNRFGVDVAMHGLPDNICRAMLKVSEPPVAPGLVP